MSNNAVAPVVKITLDKERNLLVDLNAMAAFEEATGKSLMRGIDIGSVSMKDYRALIWACLIHEDEKLTVEKVGKMIHAGNMGEISELITKAFELAAPETGDSRPLTESRSPG